LTKKTEESTHVEITLDTSAALVQAAHSLEEAAQMSRDKKDIQGMLEVANGWLTIAALLDAEDGEEAIETIKQHKTGFHHE
jgi:hypothetical protein